MSALDRATPAEILDFETIRDHGVHKHVAIRERFGCSPWRYQQHLYRLIDDPEVFALDPVLVGAIRRHRERLRYLRTSGVADVPRANPRQRPLPLTERSSAC